MEIKALGLLFAVATTIAACGQYPTVDYKEKVAEEAKPVPVGVNTPRGEILGTNPIMREKRYTFLFETDKSSLSYDSKEQLDAIVDYIETLPAYEIRIEGRADPRGSQEYNEALAQQRADTIYEYISSKSVRDADMILRSFGERKPVVIGDTDWGHSQNRRVDLIITPLLE